MTRSSLVLVLTLAFGFCFQVSAQHHEPPEAAAVETSGPLSSVNVTFGVFAAQPRTCSTLPTPCPPLDRFLPGGNAAAYNHHSLTPQLATIQAGGTVNFIIGGFHVLAIYDDGVKPSDLDTTLIVPPAVPGGPPRVPELFNDPTNRIYRGLDPASLPAGGPRSDRVEAFKFDKPGLYLVVCAVVSHFNDGMYGYVRVLPSDGAAVTGQ